MKNTTLIRLLAAAAAGWAAVALAAPGQAAPSGPAFHKPVKVTPDLAGGYEPGIYADAFGNLYATAHKENAELALSPDGRSMTKTRSMSWAWYSDDHGNSWKNLPTGPAGIDLANHNFGDEGDMATDDAGNVYFVDTNVTDITFTSWHADGLGKISFKSHLPTVGFGEPVDDRPWVTAHNDGHVFYFGNEGDQNYVAQRSGETYGNGSGPGRYTVYSSYDGGQTWDHIGIGLKDSGWCRPAAEHNGPYVYAFCGNDAGKLYSFVSSDDGKQWRRYDVPGGYTAKGGGGFETFPSLQVLKDGSLWAFYLDPDPDSIKGGVPLRSHMYAYHSTNHGRTWKRYDVSPKNGAKQFEYGSLSVSADGKTLGYAVYGRSSQSDLWRVYATTFRLGQKPVLTSLDEEHPVTTDKAFPEAPGDFLMATFDNRGQFHVTWTRATIQNADAGRSLFRDIYSASSR